MKYPKINTLFKRDPETWKIINEYSFPELEYIDNYDFYEKIDGTNIRIMWDGEVLEFRGRTDEATIPVHLLVYLAETFTKEKMIKVFPERKQIILYGEGYGNKIQGVGKQYREDVAFILFDCYIGMWLLPDNLEVMAYRLGIEVVPWLGSGDLQNIVDFIKSKPQSIIAKQPMTMEGIIAKAPMGLLTRNGTRIMFKLKCSDFSKKQENFFPKITEINTGKNFLIQ